jgi:hypothetical protein
MARHSSPRRLAGKRRRMESWAAPDARKAEGGQQLASMRARQDPQWPQAGQKSAGTTRDEREEEPVE